MTEFFERTVSLGPLLLCAVLRWSLWPLLPGTRPLTRHRKPHLPRGRVFPRPVHPGPPPPVQSALLTVFDVRERPLAKRQLKESTWAWRLSVARTRIDSWQHSRSVTVSHTMHW